jgi:hypothetical protein
MYLIYKTEITIQFGMIKRWLNLLILFKSERVEEEEGLKSNSICPIIDEIFNTIPRMNFHKTDTEILLTTMCLLPKVFHGIDVTKTSEIGWFLPEKKTFIREPLGFHLQT